MESLPLKQVNLPDHPEISASRVVWGVPLSGDAGTLLEKSEGFGERADGGKIKKAMDWLRAQLSDSEMLSAQVTEAAQEESISDKTLRTARERLKSTSINSL